MNKVFNINLGGLPLIIDEDAYRYLENYLQSLHNHFRNSEGYEEIMNDIEARIGELLKENMGKRSIAMMQDVKNAVSVMGTPEDFGAESIVDNDPQQKSGSSASRDGNASSSTIKTGKKLYRDPENKVVSGVCSGIAAYFGIQDALWVRLAFLGIISLFGTGILLYFILTIILPEAKTTADRLAMQGEPIDVNSIAKSVEKGVDTLAKKVNEFGNPDNQERFNAQISQASSKIGEVIQAILSIISKLWKFIIGFLAIGLIVTMLISWITGAIGLAMTYPVFSYITDSHLTPPVAIFCAFLIISIPIVLLVLFLRRLFLFRSTNSYIIGSLWAVWGIALGALISLAGRTGQDFNQKADNTQVIELANPNTEILTIKTQSNRYGDINTQMGRLRISEDFLLSYDVRLRIVKSESNKFELTKNIHSRGRNQEEARRYISNIDYKIENIGNELYLPNEFQILKGTKWRDQGISMTLRVPVGKRILIKKEHPHSVFVDLDFNEMGDWEDNEACWRKEEAIWEMTKDGLKCMKEKKKEEEE